MTTTKKVTKKQQAENDRQFAIEELRRLFPVGSTVHTVLRHVSQSGMLRTFSVVHGDADGGVSDVSWLVARAGVSKLSSRHRGLEMGGAGMDMGFALAYHLSSVLYPDGFECIGRNGENTVDKPAEYRMFGHRCPSNDHMNEREPDFTPGRWHGSGGYALRHEHV